MKTHNAQWRYGTQAAAIGLLLVALGIGCSAPNNLNETAVIDVLTASPSTLLQGESAVIEVVVTDSQGRPRAGVVLTLAADPPSSGSFATATLTTGADGTAATIFTATSAGTVTIEATIDGGTSQYTTITVEDEASAAGNITVTITPGVMTADASSQAVVTCRVYDAEGQPVPDGTQVKLAAGEKFVDIDRNGYFTVGVDEIVDDLDDDGEWDAIGLLDAAVTTTNGLATAYYTAGSVEATVYIKATATINSSVVQKEVSLSLSANKAYLEMEVEPQSLRANGVAQALITCLVMDADGLPAPDGTEVILVAGDEFIDGDMNGIYTCCSDTLLTDNDQDAAWDAIGNIVPTVTTVDGMASAYYTADANAATVYIKATAEFNSAFVQMDFALFLIPDSGGVAIGVEPSRIRADGTTQALVTCHIYDSDGNPIADGTTVTLVAGEQFKDANLDGYYSCCNDSLLTDYDDDGLWDAIGTIAGQVTTSGGVASAYYTAGTWTVPVYITATVTDREIPIQSAATVTLLATDSIASINLAPDHGRVQVRGTGGIEWSRITATAYDAFGNRAPLDLPIDFTITAGPGGGENINGDPVGPVTALTDANGEAVVTFNAGIISGSARIRAAAGGVVSAATQIAIVSGPPAYVSVGADDCNVPSWEEVNALNEITAVVNDQWGNEVADSTAIHFWTEQGTIEGFDETNISFTERGVAASMWHSSKPKNDGIVWYWAETEGGEVADTGMFFESGLPGSTTILVHPVSMLADGRDKGQVVVETYDLNGVFMDTDYPIELKTTYGTINSGVLGDGCHSSYFETELFSQTFDQDFSYSIPDDGIVGVSLLEAIAGGYYGAYDSKTVEFNSSAAYVKNCEIDVATTIPHGFTVPVSVLIKDRYGNVLGGHEIRVSSQNGTITGPTQYTDAWGVAGGFSYTTTSNFGIEVDFLVVEDMDPTYGGISFSQKITVKEDE